MSTLAIEQALDTMAIADSAITGFDVIGELNRVYGGGWKKMGYEEFDERHPRSGGSLHDYWDEAYALEVPGGVIAYDQDIRGAVFIASRDDGLEGAEYKAELSKYSFVGPFYRTLAEAQAFIALPAAQILEERRQREQAERERQEWAAGIISGLGNLDKERLQSLIKACSAALREGQAA